MTQTVVYGNPTEFDWIPGLEFDQRPLQRPTENQNGRRMAGERTGAKRAQCTKYYSLRILISPAILRTYAES